MEILLSSINLWKSESLGVSNLEYWQNMQEVLLQMGLLSQPLDVTEAFSNEFIGE
jgi:NitT/TauT family transport system substrate-binding protein